MKAARVNNERDFICLGREIQDEPTEGALVRAVCVVLTRRRAQRAWCGVLLRTTFNDDVRREASPKEGSW